MHSWAVVIGGISSLLLGQFRGGAVLTAGALSSELVLEALDQTVLLLQLLRQPGTQVGLLTKEAYINVGDNSLLIGLSQSLQNGIK